MLAVTVKPTWAWAMLHAGANVVPRPSFFVVDEGLIGQRLAICAGPRLGDGVELHRQLRRIAFCMARAGLCAAPLWLRGNPPCLVWHEQRAGAFATKDFEAKHGAKGTSRILTPSQLPSEAVVAVATVAPLNYDRDDYAWTERDRVPLRVADLRPLTAALPLTGKHGGGLWQLPTDVEALVALQLVEKGETCAV